MFTLAARPWPTRPCGLIDRRPVAMRNFDYSKRDQQLACRRCHSPRGRNGLRGTAVRTSGLNTGVQARTVTVIDGAGAARCDTRGFGDASTTPDGVDCRSNDSSPGAPSRRRNRVKQCALDLQSSIVAIEFRGRKEAAAATSGHSRSQPGYRQAVVTIDPAGSERISVEAGVRSSISIPASRQ